MVGSGASFPCLAPASHPARLQSLPHFLCSLRLSLPEAGHSYISSQARRRRHATPFCGFTLPLPRRRLGFGIYPSQTYHVYVVLCSGSGAYACREQCCSRSFFFQILTFVALPLAGDALGTCMSPLEHGDRLQDGQAVQILTKTYIWRRKLCLHTLSAFRTEPPSLSFLSHILPLPCAPRQGGMAFPTPYLERRPWRLCGSGGICAVCCAENPTKRLGSLHGMVVVGIIIYISETFLTKRRRQKGLLCKPGKEDQGEHSNEHLALFGLHTDSHTHTHFPCRKERRRTHTSLRACGLGQGTGIPPSQA